MKEIDFINAKMNRKDAPIPQFLYKYRPFDEFTFDMLEKGYVYLCPAGNLRILRSGDHSLYLWFLFNPD